MTRQVLRSFSEIAQALPGAKEQFVEDYDAVKEDLTLAQESIQGLIDTLSGFSPLSGAGSPEGVTTSNSSQIYFDTTLSPASVTMWFNSVVNIDTGWVQVV
jgi:hypothetical protein